MNFALGFDVGAAILLTAMGTRGFYRGFLGEILSLAGLAGGVFFAWQYSHSVVGIITGYFPNLDDSIASIIAMSLIFFVITMLVAIVSKIVTAFVKFAELSLFNHIAGLLLGASTGLFLLLLVYGALTVLAPALGGGWIENSIFMNFMSKIWPTFYQFIIHQGWIDTTKLLQQIP